MNERTERAIAELVAAIREEVQAGVSKPDSKSQAPAIPVGTWFRKRWDTGRAGTWHRASTKNYSGAPYCRCGRAARPTSSFQGIETRSDVPLPSEMCGDMRKFLALHPGR